MKMKTKVNRRTVLAAGVGFAGVSGMSDTLMAVETEAPKLPKDAIILMAQLTVKAGEEDAVKEALAAMVGPTRKEEGCICYNLHQSKKDKTVFMFYEQWANQEALNKHGASDHMKKMQAAIKGKIEKGGATQYDWVK